MSHGAESFDDVVVGGGSCGAVLAARLSEDPSRRVLLLEAGPDFSRIEDLPQPLRDARCAVFSGFNWPYAVPLPGQQPGGAAGFPYAVGRVIGGSSSVNGAIALRPSAHDFARWAEVAGPLWTWEAVLPHFIGLENDLDFAGPLHGRTGPVPISRTAEADLSPVQRAFGQACRDAGLPGIDDLNDTDHPGVGRLPTNTIGGVRMSTALAYLMPARARPNLVVRGLHEVHRVVFEGGRAVGVEVLHGGRLVQVAAGRVTLCAGAINTPALLMRSGIGDADECRRLGAAPVAHLPGVGRHLMDHPALVLWLLPQETVTCDGAPPVHQLMARACSGDHAEPDLSLFMLDGFDTARMPRLGAMLGVPHVHGISVMLSRPAGRGRVSLRSGRAAEAPDIDLGLGRDECDVERLMAGVRLAWRLANGAPLASFVRSVFLWREATIASDSLLRHAVRRLATGTWHAAGTARMGPAHDAHAVVDERCRVHGVERLHVVDASVMPVLPGTPTHLCCVMLAERASAWMRQG